MSGTRILIIDDDPHLGTMLQRMLQRLSCVVFVAGGGREGIDMAHATKLSAILCDDFMPDVSGCQVVEALKSDPATAHIPILLMSGCGDPAIVTTADGFLGKPFDSASLVAALESVLPGRAAGRTPEK